MTTRRWLLALAVTSAVAYASGRHMARTPDVVQQERASETIAVTEEREATATETAHVEAAAATERVVYRERIVYREGPVAESTREVEASTSTAQLVADAARVEVRVETVEVVREVEVERRVEIRTPLPDWRAGVMAGVDLRAGLVYGAEVQRRLAGPVYVSAWGLSSGAVGLGAGVEW